jgi:hypothetical protein
MGILLIIVYHFVLNLCSQRVLTHCFLHHFIGASSIKSTAFAASVAKQRDGQARRVAISLYFPPPKLLQTSFPALWKDNVGP